MRSSPYARRLTAGIAALAVVGGGALIAPTAALAAPEEEVSTAYLADRIRGAATAGCRSRTPASCSTPSIPADQEANSDQTSGPALPLHLGYYANDKALHHKRLLETYATSGERPDGAAYRTAFSESFDDAQDWSSSGVAAESEGGITTLALEGAISGDTSHEPWMWPTSRTRDC